MHLFLRSLALLALLLLPSLAAAQQTPASTLVERLHRIDRLHRAGIPDRSYRTPNDPPARAGRGTTSPAPAVASGSISGTISGLDDGTNGNIIAMPLDDTTNGGVAVYGYIGGNGTYTVNNVAPGRYVVLAQVYQYLSLFYDSTRYAADATPVVVIDGQTTTGIDFSLTRRTTGTGSISGRVARAIDSAGISGAEVYAFSPNDPFEFGYAMTDQDGNYEVPELQSGEYLVEVYVEGYGPEVYEDAFNYGDATPVRVGTGATGGIDFLLDRGGIITGVVVDGDGAPIADAWVDAWMLSGDDSGVFPTDGMATTDENGYYEVHGLAAGDYEVSVAVETAWATVIEYYDNVGAPELATPVRAAINGVTDSIDFTIELPDANGVITGTVVDSAGRAIVGAYVTVEMLVDDGSGGTWPVTGPTVETDASGGYEIGGLPDGQFLVSAFAESGWNSAQVWWPNATDQWTADAVIVTGGVSDPAAVNFTIPFVIGRASISGTVRFADSAAAPEAMIQIVPAEGNEPFPLYVYTDAQGRYTIPSLGTGSYSIRVQHWRTGVRADMWYPNVFSQDSAATLIVRGDTTITGIDMTLPIRQYYGTITGRVTHDSTGAGIERAFVEVFNGEWSFDEAARNIRYGITDANGFYTVDSIPTGRHIVSVYGDGAWEVYPDQTEKWYGEPITVGPDSTTTLDIGISGRNDGTGVIRGRVVGDGSRTPEIAIITVESGDFAFETMMATTTKSDGTYEITGLPRGTYFVSAEAPGFIGEYYSNAFDPYDATPVLVNGTDAATGVDFSLGADVTQLNAGVAVTGTIGGRVVSTDDDPIADAHVYLLDADGNPIAVARTGSEGTYEIAGVPAGVSYRLWATAAGHGARYSGNATTLEMARSILVAQSRRTVDFRLPTRGVSGARPSVATPAQLEISGVSPNPFTDRTAVSLALSAPSDVRLHVVDHLGRTVITIEHAGAPAGPLTLGWDGRDASGQPAPAGAYLLVAESHGERVTVPVVVVR